MSTEIENTGTAVFPAFRAPAIAVITSFLALEAYILHNISFLNISTLAYIVLSSMLTLVLFFHLIPNNVDSLAEDDVCKAYWFKTFLAMLVMGLACVGLATVATYNADVDMARATSLIHDTKAVASSEIMQVMQKYTASNPAHQFLTQYYLLPKKDGNSQFVWNLVQKRAAYISKLYHNGDLVKTASIPNFGFLHTNTLAVNAIMTSSTNSLTKHDDFYKVRRHGYAVRYTNHILSQLRNVVSGHSFMLDGIATYTRFLSEVQQKRRAGVHFNQLPEIASQLNTTVNVQQATNTYLGRGYSLRKIMRSYLLKGHTTAPTKVAKP